jgi:hypothetical protein
VARQGRSCARASGTFGLKPNDVVQATRLPFDPGSPSRRPTWRGSGARRSCCFEKDRQKQPVIQRRIKPARSAEGPFSLRRGLKSERDFLKLGITPWRSMGWVRKRRRRPSRIAFARAAMRLET